MPALLERPKLSKEMAAALKHHILKERERKRQGEFKCWVVCLFNWSLWAETYLGPDRTRLKRNAQARLESLYIISMLEMYRTYPVPSDCEIPRTIPRAAQERGRAAKWRGIEPAQVRVSLKWVDDDGSVRARNVNREINRFEDMRWRKRRPRPFFFFFLFMSDAHHGINSSTQKYQSTQSSVVLTSCRQDSGSPPF